MKSFFLCIIVCVCVHALLLQRWPETHTHGGCELSEMAAQLSLSSYHPHSTASLQRPADPPPKFREGAACGPAEQELPVG